MGFGIDKIQWVEVDDQARVKVELVPELDNKSILILQAGNVNSGAFDDFKLCVKKLKLQMHGYILVEVLGDGLLKEHSYNI
jgi:hypothetical protein